MAFSVTDIASVAEGESTSTVLIYASLWHLGAFVDSRGRRSPDDSISIKNIPVLRNSAF